MQELVEKTWENPRFHEAYKRLELSWLKHEIGQAQEPELTIADAARLMRAAAILACSENAEHRRTAFRAATWAFEQFGADKAPFDQALRVVLTRLANFPSMSTRAQVKAAQGHLPLLLAAEEVAAAAAHEIVIGGKTILLTDFQYDLWQKLTGRRRVALAAPTSAGKSFVLQSFLSESFVSDAPMTVVYLVPTRALIAQVEGDLFAQFQTLERLPPPIITVPVDSDTQLPPQAIYVMTQERLQLTLNAHPDFRATVIVVDEAHSIADGSRGVLLQWVIDDLLSRNSDAQVLFASPTIRNLALFGRLFGLKDIEESASGEPAVAQNFLITKVESAAKGKILIQTLGDGSAPARDVAKLQLDETIASRTERLVHIPVQLGKGHSNIIYANGAAEAEKIASQLADLLSERAPTEGRAALAELAGEVVHKNYTLVECVKYGVGFHYSNIPTNLRRAIEAAALSGDIDFLVCTSTLLQGVNLPAKNIFIFAPEKGRNKTLGSTDFWNLAGRAGRLQREFHGNIFLIDYEQWKKKPLDGPRDAVVVPAMETSINEAREGLIAVIGDNVTGKSVDVGLETAFVRLYTDFKRGALPQTFERMGLAPDGVVPRQLAEALARASSQVSLPEDILRRSPNISAHKQQRLYDRLTAKIGQSRSAAQSLIPLHPREPDSFQSYADILEICHELILGIDTTKNLHRFHALMARKWMQGVALPAIIEERIARAPSKSVRTVIRETLDLIETDIRFQAVRLFGCYSTLLVHGLESAGLQDLVSSIPTLPLYLEVGASDKTMVSFISLGLSRVVAMKLNEESPRKDLDEVGALNWLRSRPLETLGLSPLLIAEVREMLTSRA